MIHEKKRILIPIAGDLFIRNYLNEEALFPLSERYDLYYVISPVCTNKMGNDSIKYLGVAGKSAGEFTKRINIRIAVGYITMWAYQSRSSSFRFKFDTELSRARRYIYLILGLPILRNIVVKLSELILGRLRSMDEVINSIRPDWIIIPSGISDSFSIDAVKSAKVCGVKHILIVNGWDNISCKGVMPVLPDYMAVWGQQAKEHAVKIHKIPAQNVHIIGAPHFSLYYQPPALGRDKFRKSIGLPLDKKVILLAGSNRTMDEVSLLIEIEKAIQSGKLKDAFVLFRPHPWRTHRLSEPDFESVGFKHVIIDPQVKASYNTVTRNKKAVKPDDFIPELEYYPNLINAVDCVISPLSTFVVESLIFGKPTLAIAFSDGVHKVTPDKFIVCEHFKILDSLSGVIVCRKREDFIDDIKKLLSRSEDRNLKERIQRDIKQIAFHDKFTYAERLLSVMSQLETNP